MSRSSVALDNMRAIVILIVLGFHSVLAYVSWVPTSTAGFDSPPYLWRSFPIVDSHRFFGFDVFCAWQNVYLMSLMFFLSGLFLWPSLARKRDFAFMRDRVLRLAVPYIFGLAILMPLAFYPTYLLTAADPSVPAYWHAFLALPFWPNGQLWFLWQLLVLAAAAAALHRIAPNVLEVVGRWSLGAAKRPGPYFAVLVTASALAYVPLAVAFTPWAWSDSGIFSIQFCRPLHYAVYFFAGVGIGVRGLDYGLLATDGPLARRWAQWLAAALASFALWIASTAWTMNGGESTGAETAAAFSYVLACAAGCFCLIALCLRFAAKPSRLLGVLAANAYGLYLMHYVFVVWLQYALLPAPLFAVVKGAIVFGGTLFFSLIATTALERIPLGGRLIGSVPPAAAGVASQAPSESAPQSHADAVRSR